MQPDERCALAVSRRKFLQNGVLTAAACATNPLLALSGPRRPAGSDDEARVLPTPPHSSGSDNWNDHTATLDHTDRNAFTGAIGDTFKVVIPNAQPVWVTLIAVEDLPRPAAVNPASFAVPNKSSAAAPATSGFVLRFGSTSALQQETYLFQHATLGSLALFTVPAPDGQSYTAVINRLDGPTIIAVPFNQPAAQGNNAATGSSVTAAPATSSGTESPLPSRAGSPAARRVLVRD